MVRENTKAQMIGQVFIFVLAGLIFVLIIGYGYKAVQYFLETQEQVLLADFQTDLEAAIEGIKRDYDSVRKLELKLPSEYAGICFFDYDEQNPNRCAEGETVQLVLPDQIIDATRAQEACMVKAANVFIMPSAENMDIPDIEVLDGAVCIPNIGTITIRLQGTGKKARVSKWS